MNNFPDQKDYQKIKRQLSDKLDAWMLNQGDPGALIDSYEELNNALKGNHFQH